MATKKSFNSDLDKLLAGLDLPTDEQINKETGNKKQAEKLKGRKRKDQSSRMSGSGNSMAGKEHPNKGKKIPKISEKIKGKAKPAGFGEKVSKARKALGLTNIWKGQKRADHSEAMKDPTRNKGAQTMRETKTCPHCGKTANIPNYKRWHGDNCKMKGKK